MNFFCTEKHLLEWLEGSPLKISDIYSLNIDDAVMAAKALFGK